MTHRFLTGLLVRFRICSFLYDLHHPNMINFEVLIDKPFEDVNKDDTISPRNNKWVLSLVNDFEDGKWRYTKFQNFIWDNIAETSLTQRERESLVNHSLLTAAAKNLRLTDKDNDIGRGSELAEIVLYGFMKHHFGALPVVPKIFYKQNVQDNAKGADSVHIVIEKENDFTLWFGEAKFYNNIEDARLASIIESVGNALATDKMKKENSIITNVSDIHDLAIDNDLRDKIIQMLSPHETLDILKPKLNIPILLLHECSVTAACTEMSNDYRAEIVALHIDRAHAYFKKQIQSLNGVFKYADIKFHLILFPVPSKKDIVDKFVSNVEHYKNQ